MKRSVNATRMKRWMRRLAVLPMAAMLAVVMLGGCKQERVEQGDPPAGYETWDDYWQAQDKLNRQLELDQERRLRNQPYDRSRSPAGLP